MSALWARSASWRNRGAASLLKAREWELSNGSFRLCTSAICEPARTTRTWMSPHSVGTTGPSIVRAAGDDVVVGLVVVVVVVGDASEPREGADVVVVEVLASSVVAGVTSGSVW